MNHLPGEKSSPAEEVVNAAETLRKQTESLQRHERRMCAKSDIRIGVARWWSPMPPSASVSPQLHDTTSPTFQSSQSAGDAYHDGDLCVRAPQAAGLADGRCELRNCGAQPQAARTHLVGMGPDHGSGVYWAGLARG